MSTREEDLRARYEEEDRWLLLLLEALVVTDLALLELRGDVPALADSGVAYSGWQPIADEYGDVETVLARGVANAAELAAWRAAELRRSGAAARVVLRRKPDRPWICSVLVLHGDAVEDATDLVPHRPLSAADLAAGLTRCAGCAAGEALVGADVGHEHYRRASGEVACPACGEPYRKHPHAVYLDWQGEPWLTRLCSGDLVKL